MATIREGCNYQNENFQMESLIKGRGTVLFLRALSALIQAMYYCVPHKHYHTTRLTSYTLPWGGSRPRERGVVKLCIQLKNVGKSWPKGKLKIRKDKVGKREKKKAPVMTGLQQCSVLVHI